VRKQRRGIGRKRVVGGTRRGRAGLLLLAVPGHDLIALGGGRGEHTGVCPPRARPTARVRRPKRVYIGVNGEVVPCCLAGVPVFDNMMEHGFAAGWNGETYRTCRRHVYTGKPHGMCPTVT
jgi:hypothetical protein